MAYKQRWSDYFELLDANHNGSIAADDIEEGVKLTAKSFGLKEGSAEYELSASTYKNYLTNLIKSADSNKDGKVTKEEFLSAAEKIVAGGPANVPGWLNEAIRAQFALGDTNKSGDVSLEEYKVVIKRIRPELTDDAIKGAYDWALKLSPSGKLDINAVLAVTWVWSSSPDPTPEAEILLPYYKKY